MTFPHDVSGPGDAHEVRASLVPLPFILLAGLFIGGLVTANLIAIKLIDLFVELPGIGAIVVPAGVLAYSITFLCTDVISEVYGLKAARRVVLAGLFALAAALGLTQAALAWPAAPGWAMGDAYGEVFGSTWRIIIASVVAYLVAQWSDVTIFHMIKRRTGGRFLWLRNNVSTMCSQLLDSVIFVVIAFAFLPGFDLLPIILGQWLAKMLIAAIDTPLVYGGVWLIRQEHDFRN